MKRSNLLVISSAVLFLMLWLPLGQYDFLLAHWMKIGTYAVPFLLIGAFALTEKDEGRPLSKNYRFIGIIMLIAYIIHQYEEHWIDLFGNYYAFYTFNNNFILGNLGEPDSTVRPLSEAAIFVINTSLVWLVGVLAILRSPKQLFPLIAMASIIVVNGIVHILASIVNFQYNPGLLTSVVLFLPLYFWFIKELSGTMANSRKQIIGGLIWAVLAHVIMVAGLLMANWFQIIPELLYFFVLVAWSILPAFMYRNAQ